MKPRVGITTADRKSRLSWACEWLAVKRAGGIPVRISPSTKISFSTLDALIIGGGEDIGPEIYNGTVTLGVKLNPARDRLELDYLQEARKRQFPILGICRGAQMLNVSYGGTLHGEILEAYKLKKNKRTVLPKKTVQIKKGTKTFDIIGKQKIRVNSLHHQSVKKLGKPMRISAKDKFGIIQAIENPKKRFMVGVQWHPEFLIFHRGQQRLFRRLIQSC